LSELQKIYLKYQSIEIPSIGADHNKLARFSSMFFSDTVLIFEIITRLQNIVRNQSGFSLFDAPILGLLVKVSKTLLEMVLAYEAGNSYLVKLLQGIVFESAILARYLLEASPETLEDYRRCSFKNTLSVCETLSFQSELTSSVGMILKNDIHKELSKEGLGMSSFELQKEQGWRVDGKDFYEILSILKIDPAFSYFWGENSIHCGWKQSKLNYLSANHDQTYSANTAELPNAIERFCPLIGICTPAFSGWSERVQLTEHKKSLRWVSDVNQQLLLAFEFNANKRKH
jgi:hypothetical protein